MVLYVVYAVRDIVARDISPASSDIKHNPEQFDYAQNYDFFILELVIFDINNAEPTLSLVRRPNLLISRA